MSFSIIGRLLILLTVLGPHFHASAQVPANRAEHGSQTAKNGFKNEDEVAAKFNRWKTDPDAINWLTFMGHKPGCVESVLATKPHGEKADIQVKVQTRDGVRSDGISIKLVSSRNGFNQIDKRWMANYARMWKMPVDIVTALRLFVGESRPNKSSRNAGRMYIDEFDAGTQKKIVEFFTNKKIEIVSDLLKGNGEFSAAWMLVVLRSETKPRWILRSMDHTIKFYSEGPVIITRDGNLKIGRITMQRKGGDGGRDTANMLQFKINPALLGL